MEKKWFFIFCLCFCFGFSGSMISQNKTNMSSSVKSLIAKKRSFNSNYGFGYRIQIFNGNELQARKKRNIFRVKFPKVYTKLIYLAPEWKVHVGNYKTKLEADKAIVNFSDKFSGLIAVPLGK